MAAALLLTLPLGLMHPLVPPIRVAHAHAHAPVVARTRPLEMILGIGERRTARALLTCAADLSCVDAVVPCVLRACVLE